MNDLIDGSGRSFDELHIISDLHLARSPMFTQTEALAGWIRSLPDLEQEQEKGKQKDPDRRIGLVLNGNIIDFLADVTPVEGKQKPTYFHPLNAIRTIEEMCRDETFRPVLDALHEFIASDSNRRIILVVGNHDVELSVLSVARRLKELLEGQTAGGRVDLAVDGHGFRCWVGNRSVYCVHGNGADRWNQVNYEDARNVGETSIRIGRDEPWLANPGTRLVIDVVNRLKKERPFIGFLKPDDPIRLPLVIIALDRKALHQLENMLGPMQAVVRSRLRELAGTAKLVDRSYLSADDVAMDAELQELISQTISRDSFDNHERQLELEPRDATAQPIPRTPNGTTSGRPDSRRQLWTDPVKVVVGGRQE